MGIFDDEEESFETSTLYSWDDITPIEQDEGPNPVCVIAYTDECLSFSSFLFLFFSPSLLSFADPLVRA